MTATAPQSPAPNPLALFVRGLEALLATPRPEREILRGGRRLLTQLVAEDGWLPDAYARPDLQHYRQFLLYRDPPVGPRAPRFSVVSFVWGPGQFTPIHNHTVWGLIGVLRGAETSQRYRIGDDGVPAALGHAERLERGAVEAVSPTVGDVHRVSNAHADRTSVSIHVYGADIGEVSRATFTADGRQRTFVSGYSNDAATPPFVIDREIAR